ncbi:hypothetical protein LQ757_06955 [Agromyces sp. SYSU K20354]|uniref:hypothetical protein n=1 Tax=Agromyces cavernae TaxID=2898659 RepID=UPI001E2B1977|nr:hypothetical protein [Agromyces cavernae]MCD2442016.1 hypothetical protein [Agromyces cavernae]
MIVSTSPFAVGVSVVSASAPCDGVSVDSPALQAVRATTAAMPATATAARMRLVVVCIGCSWFRMW